MYSFEVVFDGNWQQNKSSRNFIQKMTQCITSVNKNFPRLFRLLILLYTCSLCLPTQLRRICTLQETQFLCIHNVLNVQGFAITAELLHTEVVSKCNNCNLLVNTQFTPVMKIDHVLLIWPPSLYCCQICMPHW